MGAREWINAWPVLRQLRGEDPLGRGSAVQSQHSAALRARTEDADTVTQSICPFCAVGCGQTIHARDGQVIQIEGDPDSPISRGRLCPKGAASLQLTTGESRHRRVLYRPPHATDFQEIDLDTAMDMVVDRVIATRSETWEEYSEGDHVARTLGIASLGGATLDNEENYLIKKLLTALGVIQVENQARVCHSSTVAGLGTSFGRGGATTLMQDQQHSDCIVIQGSNYAECHPVGFQWVMEAKARGATVIHVDPRFTRTSAVADLHVPIRAGSDIAFLGGIINHVLGNGLYFHDYVVNYTNAATLVTADFADTEDGDGLFSGFDESARSYDITSWQYDGMRVTAAAGERFQHFDSSTGRPEQQGAGGVPLDETPRYDETLSEPHCVFQILKRHYARYTPELVEELCGVPQETFRRVCTELTDNSGPERTSAFCYAVGWTQHTSGSQYIRTASILQLLLGNIGRPGGGIQALRGHANIQGSSDIPALFNLLPGYIPMPHAHEEQSLDNFVRAIAPSKGYWANMRAYVVSLLRAWWGETAAADNDFCFDYLPRLTGSHSTYDTVHAQLEGTCKGYFLMGENPAVGSANAKLQRLGMANLDWLVVRDFSLIESATWWRDGPEIESGELRSTDIGTEVFFFPAASHTEKSGSYTNTNRWVQWHWGAVEPTGDSRSDLWFAYHLGQRIRAKLRAAPRPEDRPVLDLTWDYPTHGPQAEPDPEAVLAEINGHGPTGQPLSSYEQLAADGTTSCGCWIYCGVFADGINQAARKRPGGEQEWTAREWAWSWPANRRVLYNRASADPQGRPWSERKALVWWDGSAGRWVGHDEADMPRHTRPDHVPAAEETGGAAVRGDDPFIMQADGKGWLYAPAGLNDGPLPTHYEPQDSLCTNPLYAHQRNPTRLLYPGVHNRYHPSDGAAGTEVYPFVITTYRLTEHFTAGGMSRWTPYLSELQPEFFCEVSPELAAHRGLEHGHWATIVTARGAVEARVLVTPRMTPLRVEGRHLHVIGLPYHWGTNGHSTGDAANELSAITLDPNSHIQEVKALTADIRPGRRPRGAAREELVRRYQQRAGVSEQTGIEV